MRRFNADIIVDGEVTSNAFKRPAGVSTNFLKEDGSVDSNTYSVVGHEHDTTEINIDIIAGANITKLDTLVDYKFSSCVFSGGLFTDNADGTIAVAAGNGQIRTTNSIIGNLKQVSWSLVSSLALTDLTTNYIYLEYNGGTPQIVADTTERTDLNTNIFLGQVFREGTVARIYDTKRIFGGNHTQQVAQRFQKTDAFARESGAIIGETGTRNITLTAGAFWEGVDRFTTPAFDSSASGTFEYYYRDGVGGFTKQTAQTQINNTQYDDGSGTLANITNNRFTNAWVYLGAGGGVYVMFGRVNATSISGADAASPPSDVPLVISDNARLVGRIIVEEGQNPFTQIDSAFTQTFTPAATTDHNTLSNLQGGTASEYYHLTSAEYTTKVSKVGTPVDNQIGVWTGDGTIEGNPLFTYDGTTFYVGSPTFGATKVEIIQSGVKVIKDASSTTTEMLFDRFRISNGTAGVYNILEGTSSGTTNNVRLPDAGAIAKTLVIAVNGTNADSAGNVVIAGGGDMILASAQTNSGIKTFLDTTMKLRNVANTFDGYFVNTNTADRVYTLKDAAGTLAFTSDITGINSGTNTGDQTITLTGDVTGSGTSSFAATIANNVVSNAKLSTIATSTIKGRITGGTGDVEDLTAAQVRTVTSTAEATGFAKIHVGTVAPSTPATGDLWVDTN